MFIRFPFNLRGMLPCVRYGTLSMRFTFTFFDIANSERLCCVDYSQYYCILNIIAFSLAYHEL